MLPITIPSAELFNEETYEITTTKETKLQLEHSLLSISKWESKWEKPFLSKDKKTPEEMIDYIKCMTITQNVDPIIYSVIPDDVMNEIITYIEAKMTASWFPKERGGSSREIVTSEILYYDMIALNIPFECEKWHLNRLLALIKVCNAKNNPGKKMSKKNIMNQNRAINAARRAKNNSKG